MDNPNLLSNMRCPKCAQTYHFTIACTCSADVTDDSADPQGSLFWNGDSECSCDCGFDGTIKDCLIENQPTLIETPLLSALRASTNWMVRDRDALLDCLPDPRAQEVHYSPKMIKLMDQIKVNQALIASLQE